jgi:hypothetical protein
MGFHSYIVAAGFHTRVDAIEAMKEVVARRRSSEARKMLIEPAKERHFYPL